MADHQAPGAPALDTNIESGNFDEKRAQQQRQQQHAPAKKAEAAGPADEDEDEDIDALIEDLESQDGHDAFEEEEEDGSPGGGRVIPEDMLQTDSRVGLTESEVVARRRKYGLNQMKEEKENLILKFFSYFVGPIQFVMEVSRADRRRFACCPPPARPPLAAAGAGARALVVCAGLPRCCFGPVFFSLAFFSRRLHAPHKLPARPTPIGSSAACFPCGAHGWCGRSIRHARISRPCRGGGRSPLCPCPCPCPRVCLLAHASARPPEPGSGQAAPRPAAGRATARPQNRAQPGLLPRAPEAASPWTRWLTLLPRSRPLPSLLPVSRTGSILVSSAVSSCSTPALVSSRSSRPGPLSRSSRRRWPSRPSSCVTVPSRRLRRPRSSPVTFCRLRR